MGGGGGPPLVRKDGQALVWEPRRPERLPLNPAIRMSWYKHGRKRRERKYDIWTGGGLDAPQWQKGPF